MNRGNSLDQLGKYDAAIESYDRAIKLNPDDYRIWLYRGETLFKLNYWQEGFESLTKSLNLVDRSQTSYVGDLKAIISIIFKAQQDKSTWLNRIKTLVELYDRFQLLSSLSKGITANIPDLLSEMFSNKAAQTWLQVWQEIAGEKPELEIPLRWLKTAVSYKETKRDRKVLLQLPKEERNLFITLLQDTEKEFK